MEDLTTVVVSQHLTSKGVFYVIRRPADQKAMAHINDAVNYARLVDAS